MITPSINAERQREVSPMSEETSLEEVLSMICSDVNELHRLYELQARDTEEAVTVGRQRDIRIVNQIKAWEKTQDTHWSWYKEILDASTAAAQGLEGLGQATVGSGN